MVRHGLAILALAAMAPPVAGQVPEAASGLSHGMPVDAASLFDASGYRMARYRAPVDRMPAPALRIALADALKLRPGQDALFIDVLPAEGGKRDPLSGTWALAQTHETIPGALWHPETGRASPDVALWHGLHETVAQAREKAPGLPVIVFCRTDCWMAWNAARRLARDGFGNVHWLAEGIEGWHEAGRTLVRAEPVVISRYSSGSLNFRLVILPSRVEV